MPGRGWIARVSHIPALAQGATEQRPLQRIGEFVPADPESLADFRRAPKRVVEVI